MKLESIENYRALLADRMSGRPDVPYYSHASRELRLIDEAVAAGRVTKSFLKSLTTGVMCVKEVEHIDPGFCDAYYKALEPLYDIAGVGEEGLYG